MVMSLLLGEWKPGCIRKRIESKKGKGLWRLSTAGKGVWSEGFFQYHAHLFHGIAERTFPGSLPPQLTNTSHCSFGFYNPSFFFPQRGGPVSHTRKLRLPKCVLI